MGAKKSNTTPPCGETVIGDPKPSLLDELKDHPVSSNIIATGLSDVDDALRGGLHPGSLTIIGGHSGVGSSTLALGIARTAAITHAIVTNYWTLVDRDVTRRIVSGEAGVRLHTVEMTGDPVSLGKISAACERVAHAPLTVIETNIRRSDTLLWNIETDIWGRGAKLVVVDALNFVGATSQGVTGTPDTSPELRSSTMADFARKLKVMAVDNEVAVVVVVGIPLQASRPMGPEEWFADLFAIGPAGDVADNVLLVYRPDRWCRDDPRAGETDVLVAKGCTFPKRITVANQLHIARFSNMPGTRQ